MPRRRTGIRRRLSDTSNNHLPHPRDLMGSDKSHDKVVIPDNQPEPSKDQCEHPSGLTLTFILLAAIPATPLVSLDMVSWPDYLELGKC